MGSWYDSWGSREEQLPQKEIMYGKSIIVTSNILDTWSDTEAEAHAGEVDMEILRMIREDKKNTGEVACLQPKKNATDQHSTPLLGGLLVEESQTKQEKLMSER
jgi:hypothetical protein